MRSGSQESLVYDWKREDLFQVSDDSRTLHLFHEVDCEWPSLQLQRGMSLGELSSHTSISFSGTILVLLVAILGISTGTMQENKIKAKWWQ
jgi:hypothetical protein